MKNSISLPITIGLSSLFGLQVVLAQTEEASKAPADTVVLSEHGSGRATGYAEANKIVTFGGKTHVAWLDSQDAGFHVRIRTLDLENGEWSAVTTIGAAADNHGGPALTIDSRGHLHVAYYPHHHPMRYRRSLRPNDASAWTEPVEVGERATYPTLVCGPDDTLYLTCRESRRDGPWVANLYVKARDSDWSGPRTILRSEHSGYSHFQEALAWGPNDALHLSCRIYSGEPRRGHTVGYLRSDDFGETWRRADGGEVELPASAKTVDIIAQEREGEGVGLRCGTLAVDDHDRPHVLYSTYDSLPTRAWLASPDDEGHWRSQELHPPRDLAAWGYNLPGGITFDTQGRLHALLTLMRPSSLESLWGHPTSEVAALTWDRTNAEPRFRLLSPIDSERPHWLPNLERPTGHHRVDRPGVIFTDGGRGTGNSEILSNAVRWLRLE